MLLTIILICVYNRNRTVGAFMYICICNQVTDTEIRVEIERGNHSVRLLRETLGVTNQCGKCGKCVRKCIKEHRETTALSDQLIPSTFNL